MAPGKRTPHRSKAASPPRGRPPLDETERKHILDATTAVFLEKGFLRASTDEITAARADLEADPLCAFPHQSGAFRRRNGRAYGATVFPAHRLHCVG